MDTIIILSKDEVDQLREALDPANTRLGSVHTLRVNTESGAAKFKVNGGCWSPPVGKLDPQCEAALRNSEVTT